MVAAAALAQPPGGDQPVGGRRSSRGRASPSSARLERRPRTRRRTGGSCRSSRRSGRGSPPPPGRSRNSSGWRQKNWSSASSPATYIARPPRSVRPARPHCWRRLATVPGEGDRHRRVEVADVDPQLERVRRHDAEQLSAREVALDLAPLLWRVAGAVGRDAIGVVGRRPRAACGRTGRSARPRGGCARSRSCAPRPRPGRRTGSRPRPGWRRGAPVRSSSSGGLHITTSRWPRARAVAVDEVELEPGQLLRQRQRVGDRGRGEHEPRLGPVGLREPPQPPQHVRDVRAEHAAVDVRLVDDHQRQVREEVAPRRRGAAGCRRAACPDS